MIEHREPGPRFAVLGPVQVCRDGVPLSLGPIQRQVVLAVLLFRANHPAGRQELIDAVWADPPAYAVNLVQKHVSDLRRLLEPDRAARGPSQQLRWTAAGYLLTVPPGWLDLAEFDGELARAWAARAAGDLAAASAALHR